MADLTDPSERYQDSYLEALQEFQAEGRHLEILLEEVAAHFGDFVQHLREQADRSKIKPGRVPHWHFWLIDGSDYIDRLILRCEVNEHLLQMGGHIGYEIRPPRRRQGYGRLILKYGLERAKARGLERVLLTCDEDNLGSRRIIESHGGTLENIIEVESGLQRRAATGFNCISRTCEQLYYITGTLEKEDLCPHGISRPYFLPWP